MNPQATPLLGHHVHADLDRILIDRDRIAGRVVELADEISHDLGHLSDRDELVLVSVLTGSIIFLADLIRHLPQKLRIEVIAVESYPGRATTSRGARITSGLAGTMRLIRDELAKRRPKSVRSCVLLRKQRPSALDIPCEYVGFDIPDVFVVGYGLDYNNYYRNLPDIGTLKETAL
ncbi:MAG: phosphoribosyltransferase [Planctomycetota bacterium]|jgi:hypoxanthine phosphoribosyltransferase